MSNGMLKDVLQLEKQIEADLAREQEKATAWLEATCIRIDAEQACRQETIDQSCRAQIDQELAAARADAAAALRRERRWARQLAGLPDDRLRPLLEACLQPILTGRDDDRPDDQG